MNIRKFILFTNNQQRIKRHVLFWLACYIFLIISHPPNGGGSLNGLEKDGFGAFYEMVIIRSFFHLLCQMIFCYPLVYILMPYFWQKKYVSFICLLLVLWSAVAAFRYIAYSYIYNPIMEHLGLYINPAPLVLLLSVTQTISGPAFTGIIFIAIRLFKDWQQKQKDNFELQKENIQAELQILKAQVHPHFLFNTLNNIYFFILTDAAKAKVLVQKLEKLLAYMITKCNVRIVSLSNEIELIHNYLELEKIRYENLDIEITITGDYYDKMIVPLLMIPFIENSFKHGASKVLRKPWIKLFIQADDEMLHFTLANNKPPDVAIEKKYGIGLSNVKKRLAILYPEKHYLTIEPTENTFIINMQIPLERENKT